MAIQRFLVLSMANLCGRMGVKVRFVIEVQEEVNMSKLQSSFGVYNMVLSFTSLGEFQKFGLAFWTFGMYTNM